MLVGTLPSLWSSLSVYSGAINVAHALANCRKLPIMGYGIISITQLEFLKKKLNKVEENTVLVGIE